MWNRCGTCLAVVTLSYKNVQIYKVAKLIYIFIALVYVFKLDINNWRTQSVGMQQPLCDVN